MTARSFALRRSDDGPLYEGPHGPLVLPAEQEPRSTRLRSPEGEARLDWGMLSDDRAALARGVSLQIAGRDLVLGRAGRSLEVQDGAGQVVAIVRRGPRRRVAIERPDGAEVAWFKPSSLAGEVEEHATADEVVLLLLVMGSNAAAALERRIPMPYWPFG